ncbi:hypothetical protein HPP92_016656, partial [Vanilla planifolia]
MHGVPRHMQLRCTSTSFQECKVVRIARAVVSPRGSTAVSVINRIVARRFCDSRELLLYFCYVNGKGEVRKGGQMYELKDNRIRRVT